MNAAEARVISDRAQNIYTVYDAVRKSAANGSYFLFWLDSLSKDEKEQLVKDGYRVGISRTAGGGKKYIIEW